MATTKRTAKQKQLDNVAGLTTDRPHMPGYGVPNDKKGLLSWSHVTERMAAAQNYWICSVSPGNQPHATPVWGLWLDDRLYFGGGTATRWNRNLIENPAVCIHLESGSDVVILHGEAQPLRAPGRDLTLRLADASATKYGYRPKPEDYEKPGTYVFRPRKVLAWKQFPKDATRWQFEDGD